MYTKKLLDSDFLLRWCKLLDYIFFMFYHSHLQMHKHSVSIAKLKNAQISNDERQNYVFRNNLYMSEIMDWLLIKLNKGELTVYEINHRIRIYLKSKNYKTYIKRIKTYVKSYILEVLF